MVYYFWGCVMRSAWPSLRIKLFTKAALRLECARLCRRNKANRTWKRRYEKSVSLVSIPTRFQIIHSCWCVSVRFLIWIMKSGNWRGRWMSSKQNVNLLRSGKLSGARWRRKSIQKKYSFSNEQTNNLRYEIVQEIRNMELEVFLTKSKAHRLLRSNILISACL